MNKIPIGFISRDKAGGSDFIYNIRKTDGVFSPVKNALEYNVPQDVNFIHYIADDASKYHISWRNTDIDTEFKVYDQNGEVSQKIIINARTSSVKAVGKTLCLATDKGLRYILYRDGKYSFIGSLNSVPKLRLAQREASFSDSAESVGSVYAEESVAKLWCDRFSYIDGLNDESYPKVLSAFIKGMREDFYTLFSKTANAIVKNGFLPQVPIMVRLAVRLYDGSHILPSAPVLLTSPNIIPINSISGICYDVQPLDNGDLHEDFKNGHRIEVPFYDLQYRLQTDISDKWEDIVSAIDIFISPYILPFKLDEDFDFKIEWDDKEYSTYRNFFRRAAYNGACKTMLNPRNDKFTYDRKEENELAKHMSASEYREWRINRYQMTPLRYKCKDTPIIPYLTDSEQTKAVEDCNSFYLLKSIPFKEFSKYNNNINASQWVSLAEEIKAKFPTLTARTADVLAENTASLREYVPQDIFVYNNSLNLFNVKSIISNGWHPDSFIIESELKTVICKWFNNRQNILRRGIDHTVDSYYTYTNAFSIADVNINGASKPACVPPQDTAFNIHGYISPLVSFPSDLASRMSLAVLFQNDTDYSYTTIPLSRHTLADRAFYLNGLCAPLEAINRWDKPVPKDKVYAVLYEPNRLIQSSIANPFVMSNLSSNLVGTGKIIALGVAMQPLSTGQFGQHALYVFCSDGIFALSVNTQGQYQSVHPLSNDILLSPKLIASSANAIFFATAQGVKYLVGAQAYNISETLESAPLTADNHSIMAFIANNKMTSDLASLPISRVLSIDGLEMHYDYTHSEIWLVKPQYAESDALVYSIRNKGWSSRSFNAYRFIDAYPSLMALSNTNAPQSTLKVMRDISTDAPTGTMKSLLVTNSINDGTFFHLNDACLNEYIKTTSASIATFCGNTPYSSFKANSLNISSDSPREKFSLHIPRVQCSMRFLQFAASFGEDSQYRLDSFNVDISTDKYNKYK